MEKKLKQKFKHTWTHISKNYNPKEFIEQENVLFEEMDKDNWELVQILDLKDSYKYYFKKNIS
jgi:hypothetical protein